VLWSDVQGFKFYNNLHQVTINRKALAIGPAGKKADLSQAKANRGPRTSTMTHDNMLL
jgi:hypothetical protein